MKNRRVRRSAPNSALPAHFRRNTLEDKSQEGRRWPRSRRKIVRESRWLRVREVKPNVFSVESKLFQDRLEIDPEDFDRMWSQLSSRDLLDLCHAYDAKPEITKNDERVLNIMMEKGDEIIWRNLAGGLTRHSDRARVLAFLRSRIREQSSLVANYYRALETIGDKGSVPLLLQRYRAYRSGAEAPDLANEALCVDYLTCCRALWKLTGTARYRRAIAEHIDAEPKFLRDLARRLLEQS
jgi:hypothetical protein